MNKLLNILALLAIVCFASCHKDIDEETTMTTTPVQPPTVILQSEGDVLGYVYDENNAPVSGVSITILNASTTTDAQGAYYLKGIVLDRNGTYVTAEKDGYIFGSDMIYPDKSLSYSYIKLMSLSNSGNFSAGQGGQINIDGGGTVSFGPNAIQDASGNAYTGNVTVTAKRLAVDMEDLADLMPGALLGEDADGVTRVLGTAGMVAIELRGDAGQELNLADGSTADITFPIAASQSDAPNQIPLWSFDEANGIWKEDGVATRQGNEYVGTVSHFSFWNCDAPFPLVHICGQVLFEDGSPAANQLVSIVTGFYGIGYGYTDENGNFCGKVPKNVPLIVQVFNPYCPEQVFSEQVGPFSTDVTLDPITISSDGVSLTGTVFCLQDPVTEGYVAVTVGFNTMQYAINDDGTFSADLSAFSCDNVQDASIYAVNSQTGEVSPAQVIMFGDTIFSVVLQTCADCGLNFDLEFSSGDACQAGDETLEVVISSGTGNYDYSWNNGETTPSINTDEFGEYCVTVSDLGSEDCALIKCFTTPFDSVGVFVSANSSNASCGLNNGFAGVWTSDQSPLNSVVWTGPNGFTSMDQSLENLAPGEYMYSVETTFGCMVEGTVTITDTEGLELWPFADTECEFGFAGVEVGGGQSPYTYLWDNGATDNFIDVFDPGVYCITVTDALGCTGETCVDIFFEAIDPFGSYENTCNGDTLIMEFLNPQYTYSIDSIDEIFVVDIPAVISIYDIGFQFWLNIADNFTGCSISTQVNLPRFTGLEGLFGTSPSSDSNQDGFITITLDDSAACNSCEGPFTTAVYNVEDLNTDLSAENQAQQLGFGEYYVSVFDSEGCLVAFESISL